MFMSLLTMSLILIFLIVLVWLLITNNYHYILQPANWQLYKLRHKLKFYPYMFGVNTRFYSIVTFRFWGWILFITKLFILKKNINVKYFFNFLGFRNILYVYYDYFFFFFRDMLTFYIDLLIIKDSFLEDRVYLWLEWLDILFTWFSWFSHFPEVSFRDLYSLELNYKHTFLFLWFYPYLRLRAYYFKSIVITRIVASSRRRRFKAY